MSLNRDGLTDFLVIAIMEKDVLGTLVHFTKLRALLNKNDLEGLLLWWKRQEIAHIGGSL